MTKAKDNPDEYVVTAGYVTVEMQVGAGRAYVDVPYGSPLPDDVSDEQRTRLIDSGAVARRDHKPDDAGDGTTDRLGMPIKRPVPGLVEPDEIDTDVIPAGSAEQVLEWVGDDLARARVALHTERAKGLNTREGLVTELEKVMASVETEPPAVPESLPDDGVQVGPAAGGGITVPDVEPGAGGGQGDSAAAPAKAAPAPAKATKAAAKPAKATGTSRS